MSGVRLVAVTSTGQVSGAERVLVRLLGAASRAGWDVTCAAPDGVLADHLARVGVRHVAVPELGIASGPRSLALPRMLVRWARAARVVDRLARESDVMVVNSLTALPVVRLARVRPPVVWLAHDVLIRPDRLRLYRACRGALDRVLAVSAVVAAPLRSPFGPPIEVVHNGVPWPVDPVPDGLSGPPVVGISAVLTPWKGHDVLLDAVPLMPDGVVVELMGGELATDADHADALRARCAAPALRERVRVLGHVCDPVDRMRSWSVAVSASVEPEACPLNVLEAMSIGVPVVATAHGGAPEVLAGAGLLVPPGDAGGLAESVGRLLTDQELHARCTALGRERIAAAHRLDRQTEAALVVLSDVARGVAS